MSQPADAYPLDEPARPSAEEIAQAWQAERPDLPADSITIVTPLWRISKLLADDRRRLLAEHEMDPATLDLLSTLRRAGPPYRLTTRELAHRSLVTAGAISQRLARSEAAGLVTRSKAAGRPKTVTVTLTEKGFDRVDAVVGHILRRQRDCLTALTPEQHTILADLLGLLLDDLSGRLPR